MISIQKELIFQALEELEVLMQSHFEEVAKNECSAPLSPQWSKYRTLESINAFVLYTVRDDGKLVGYSSFFVNHHMHHEAKIFAHNDVVYIHHDHRRGHTGLRLIDFCELSLSQLGVWGVTWNIKKRYDWSSILLRRGYTPEETVYVKILGGN